MAYPTPYPQIYNPYAPACYPQYAPTQAASPLKLDTVSGKTAADVYNVEPGQTVILFDIDNPCVYKKTRNMDGKLTEEDFDLIPRKEQRGKDKQVNMDEYLKADAVERMVNDRVKEELDKRLSEISFTPKTRKTTTKGDD